MMNRKGMRVWSVLVDNAGEWLDTVEIAYLADLTSKQICSIISHMPALPIEKGETENGTMRLRAVLSEEELKEEKRKLEMMKFNITPEIIEQVYSMLSTVGWTSVSSICIETGYNKSIVSKALKLCDGVVCERRDAMTVYRRVSGGHNVPIDLRVAHTGDISAIGSGRDRVDE